MKLNILKRLSPHRKFNEELRRQIRMVIIVTFGFTIAFTWRQTLFDISKSLMNFLLNIENSAALSIAASIFVTFLSIIIIYLSAHFLKDKY